MDQFIGLDVSQELTHLCVIGGDGKIQLDDMLSQSQLTDAAYRETLRASDIGFVRVLLQQYKARVAEIDAAPKRFEGMLLPLHMCKSLHWWLLFQGRIRKVHEDGISDLTRITVRFEAARDAKPSA